MGLPLCVNPSTFPHKVFVLQVWELNQVKEHVDFSPNCERSLGPALNNDMANAHAVSSVYSENVMYFNLYAFQRTKEITPVKVLAGKEQNSTHRFS